MTSRSGLQKLAAVLVGGAAACLATTTLLTAHSQDAAPTAQSPEFEVASIKLNTTHPAPNNVVTRMVQTRGIAASKNGRITMRGLGATSTIVLIQAAYNVKDFQVFGAPSWVSSDRYDVEARTAEGVTFERMRPMLQSLLANRFQLTLRRETRQLPIYELVPARNGLKISPMKEGSCVPIEQAKPFAPLNICGGFRRQIAGFAPERRDVIEAVGVGMPTLIEFLSEESGRLVLDKTGFSDVFNFRLEFASSVDSGVGNVDTPGSAPSIYTALEEQLGMRLRSTTGPVEVLMIDRIERPSPN